MVAGHDDDPGRHGRVQYGEPAPPGPGHHDSREGEQHRPAHVHRRHRGVLVEQAGVGGVRAVHGLAEADAGVDHAEVRSQPRRHQRVRGVADQRQRGGQHQHPPEPPVVLRPPDQQPSGDQDQRDPVHVPVVVVRRPDQPGPVERERLHRRLVRPAEPAFQRPDVRRVAVRAADVPPGQPAAERVEQPQRPEDERLPAQPPPHRPVLRCAPHPLSLPARGGPAARRSVPAGSGRTGR
ncbi:MAG: hypothetical protein AVDCRST_MAG41-3777 [uncultured Corynebacteriales bacterium]|uniref:Uncharacterized protein n=1 Tax=uncultured Mycobacteriales bacterium TaxID=581187 RepID=A0A6J4JP64_9ACTN|nr:MAG: hypothetical protein AVDCRST_MAG41-3777 [uncultured Corynebacteriales bacterium]